MARVVGLEPTTKEFRDYSLYLSKLYQLSYTRKNVESMCFSQRPENSGELLGLDWSLSEDSTDTLYSIIDYPSVFVKRISKIIFYFLFLADTSYSRLHPSLFLLRQDFSAFFHTVCRCEFLPS